MIEYKNVTVSFKEGVILNDINLLIDRRSIILGPNGSGKISLIKATTGLHPYNLRRWTRSKKYKELLIFICKHSRSI